MNTPAFSRQHWISACLGLIFLVSSSAKSIPLTHFVGTDPAVIGLLPILSTAAPNLRPLPPQVIQDHRVQYLLNDGTKISGLLFRAPRVNPQEPRPLILANFGVGSDPKCNEISFFVQSLVLTQKLKADVLIVSSVTSAEFFSLNSESGLGGYDEGRILIELHDLLEQNAGHPLVSYLLGVSLGGNAALQALIEDHRQNRNRFSGAITFSGVLNEYESSKTLLLSLGHPLNEDEVPALPLTGRLITKAMIHVLTKELAQNNTRVQTRAAGSFYYSAFSARLARFKSEKLRGNWNPAVSTESVDEYLRTSSELLSDVGQLSVPVIVVHAKNDPIVPFKQFKIFQAQQLNNPRVLTYGTRAGGHWGFFDTYGADWVYQLMSEMQSRR